MGLPRVEEEVPTEQTISTVVPLRLSMPGADVRNVQDTQPAEGASSQHDYWPARWNDVAAVGAASRPAPGPLTNAGSVGSQPFQLNWRNT
jgi:hypothetical protein